MASVLRPHLMGIKNEADPSFRTQAYWLKQSPVDRHAPTDVGVKGLGFGFRASSGKVNPKGSM